MPAMLVHLLLAHRFKHIAHACLMALPILGMNLAQAAEDMPSSKAAQVENSQQPAPAYASVQENLKAMDQDGDGQVSVLELRAYLEARHGKGYEQKVMDDLEASAKGKSCATPFAQSFY